MCVAHVATIYVGAGCCSSHFPFLASFSFAPFYDFAMETRSKCRAKREAEESEEAVHEDPAPDNKRRNPTRAARSGVAAAVAAVRSGTRSAEAVRIAEFRSSRSVPEQRIRTQTRVQVRSSAARAQHAERQRETRFQQAPGRDYDRDRDRSGRYVVSYSEAVRQGQLSCDVDEHLNYCTSSWSDDPAEVAEMAEACTPDLHKQWEFAQQIETVLRETLFETEICGCCGLDVPRRDMCQAVAVPGDSRLELLRSRPDSQFLPVPTRVSLSAARPFGEGTSSGANPTYALHDYYEGRSSTKFCNDCNNSLDHKGKAPDCCILTVDRGPWPMDGNVPFPKLNYIERMAASAVKSTRYLTTVYDNPSKKNAAGHLKGHVTAFPKPSPAELRDVMQAEYPRSIATLGNDVRTVFMTAMNEQEIYEKLDTVPELVIDGRAVYLWCSHLADAYSKLPADFFGVS